ncbi:hypothetical protein AB0E69_33390 [Kribbella sp. NPDC026611]|uniref:hypothetical protein n=1 Tax=Kribbella sp. NPDC026611 TaxID=3154911 RepID=UPI0033D88A95
MLTPVGAVALGALVLDERPTLVQLAGCAMILTGSYFGTQRSSRTETGGSKAGAREAGGRNEQNQ